MVCGDACRELAFAQLPLYHVVRRPEQTVSALLALAIVVRLEFGYVGVHEHQVARIRSDDVVIALAKPAGRVSAGNRIHVGDGLQPSTIAMLHDHDEQHDHAEHQRHRNAHRHGQQIQAVRPLIDVIAGNDGQQMPIAHAHRRIAEIRTDAVVLRKNDALLPLFEPRPQNVDRLFVIGVLALQSRHDIILAADGRLILGTHRHRTVVLDDAGVSSPFERIDGQELQHLAHPVHARKRLHVMPIDDRVHGN